MVDYVYDQSFHDYTQRISRMSAEPMVRLIKSILPVSSVLDVGCACGTWLSVWKDNEVTDFQGIDGDFVDPRTLLIEPSRFLCHDLARPFHLGRQFDLVQSLEVAEHLPADRAEGFVEDLTQHGSMVLFSAAPPGQGGEQHINEQPYEYWRRLFAARGFALYDCIRPALRPLRGVSPWYRHNTFLYVRADRAAGLPEEIRRKEIKEGTTIRDLSPWTYRLRKAAVRMLPFAVRQRLAKIKARAG